MFCQSEKQTSGKDGEIHQKEVLFFILKLAF